ncbi:MAG TPA: hypothetical protein VNX86_03310 [Rhizomicrobium sp.]|jgi:hypothetical protein|nr:hypothetical protein [Rhizomicrobium sp.]
MVMGKVMFAASLVLAITAGAASAGSDEYSPARQPGTSGWAVVSREGHMVRGSNVVRVRHIDTGKYVVQFNSDVSSCAYAATIAGALRQTFPGSIVVSNRSDSVHVSTFGNNVHQTADYKFHLIVQC